MIAEESLLSSEQKARSRQIRTYRSSGGAAMLSAKLAEREAAFSVLKEELEVDMRLYERRRERLLRSAIKL